MVWYDFRLEREEKKMLEEARLEQLARMKISIEEERQRTKDSGGVVYKGLSSIELSILPISHRLLLPHHPIIYGLEILLTGSRTWSYAIFGSRNSERETDAYKFRLSTHRRPNSSTSISR